jgi:GLPGLI family protein
MKKLIISYTALFFLIANTVTAQYARFPASGIIEFEKTINMYAILQKKINKDNETFFRPAFENFKKTQPQFRKVRSTLSFTGNKTSFTPITDTENNQGFFSDEPAAGQPNIIFTDLNTATSVTQKSVFEETFLIRDSVRNITWKITDETREIAGYPCRRANAIIMDSLYVVAFYTDKIPVSGGPESFTGLPGMILGVALPHEHITWFATKVTDTPVTQTALVTPKKGKPTDMEGLVGTLKSALDRWGDYARGYMKMFLL